MFQTKLIALLVAALGIIGGTSGGYFWGHHKGYSEASTEVEAKYTKANLTVLEASNSIQNSTNKSVAVIAKTTETKKAQQTNLKETKDAEIIQITEAPVYTECNVPANGLLYSSSTVTSLNSIRRSGEPSSKVP